MKCANETVTIELKNGTSQMDTRYSLVEQSIIFSSLTQHVSGFTILSLGSLFLSRKLACFS